MSASSNFEIKDCIEPNIKRGHHIIGHEIYPKKIVNLMLQCMNKKVIEDVLGNNITNEVAKNAKIKSQKAIIRRILKGAVNSTIDPDRYVEFTAIYRQQARNGRMEPLASNGMIAIKRKIRATLCKDLYDDVDMANAHPVSYTHLRAHETVL